MKKCKVKDCKRKHQAKGYCRLHYIRKFVYKIPLTRYCKVCKKKLPIWHSKYCSDNCGYKATYQQWKKHNKEYYKKYLKGKRVTIPQFIKGTTSSVYVDEEDVEEMKPLVKKIKEKVLEDCIKNPSKYLKGD